MYDIVINPLKNLRDVWPFESAIHDGHPVVLVQWKHDEYRPGKRFYHGKKGIVNGKHTIFNGKNTMFNGKIH